MKKTSLYLCVIAMLAMILPSCLGDNESTIQGSKEFVVVNQDAVTGMKYVLVNRIYPTTWDGISAYDKGDAMSLTYKISTGSMISGTDVFAAEYASVAEGESYPVNVQKNVMVQTVDTTKQVNTAFFKAFAPSVSFPAAPLYLDRWLLNYTASIKDGEVLTVEFYYDATKQTQKDGTALPANTVIVDVFLKKSGTAVTGAIAKTPTVAIVANFQPLRNTLSPSTATAEVIVPIWFRLRTEDSKDPLKYTWTEMRNVGSLYYPKAQ